jgi:AcrR family transcriptional regulator
LFESTDRRGRAVTRISADKRREQFVEAAIRVMSREGLDAATTRRIAEEAGAPKGAFHYLFRDKKELLTAVVAAIALQVEQVLREAVDPSRGLAAAIDDGLRAFWRHVVSDDGLQLMQYELVIFGRRTPGFEWVATWLYTRYAAAAQEIFSAAAKHEKVPLPIGIDELSRFLVAAVDGLIIQYEVHRDPEQSKGDLANLLRSACLLAGVKPHTSAVHIGAEETSS